MRKIINAYLHLCYTQTELSTRQRCRDNVTIFSDQTIVGFCIMSIFVVATPFRNWDLNIFLVYEAFLRCGIVAIVAKLKNCHVSNSEHKESTTNMKEKDRKFTKICREDHHIDYVFLNKEFQDIYQLESVLHHPNKAHYIIYTSRPMQKCRP